MSEGGRRRPFCPPLPPTPPSSFNLASFPPFEIFEDLRNFHLLCEYLDLEFYVSIGGFLRDCNLIFKRVSDEYCHVCMCVLCSVLWFVMAILLCLATIWFRPAAILLELDFLSLCRETRALRNTYLDHL